MFKSFTIDVTIYLSVDRGFRYFQGFLWHIFQGAFFFLFSMFIFIHCIDIINNNIISSFCSNKLAMFDAWKFESIDIIVTVYLMLLRKLPQRQDYIFCNFPNWKGRINKLKQNRVVGPGRKQPKKIKKLLIWWSLLPPSRIVHVVASQSRWEQTHKLLNAYLASSFIHPVQLSAIMFDRRANALTTRRCNTTCFFLPVPGSFRGQFIFERIKTGAVPALLRWLVLYRTIKHVCTNFASYQFIQLGKHIFAFRP